MASLTFPEVLDRELAYLQVEFPALADGLSRASALVREGHVFLHPTSAEAVVHSSDRTQFYHVNGSCGCDASHYRPEEVCKHRLAVRLLKRVQLRMQAPEFPASPVKAEWVTEVHGVKCIKYVGLLQMAHARGLTSLTAEFISVTDKLALAKAVAVFRDGSTFAEAADSSPENGKRVGLHWPRLALTRSKARALRDALGLEMPSEEELDQVQGK